jgi:hypothetical protein
VRKACHRLHSSTKGNGETACPLPPKLHRVTSGYWFSGRVFEVTFTPGDGGAGVEIEDDVRGLHLPG